MQTRYQNSMNGKLIINKSGVNFQEYIQFETRLAAHQMELDPKTQYFPKISELGICIAQKYHSLQDPYNNWKMIYRFLLVFCAIVSTTSKLYQLFSVNRHGARYHVNDFYDGADTKPLWAELTAVGMRQNQRFGQLLRKEYIEYLNFLSDSYNSSEIEVYTTHTNRTQLSAQSLMYGVYPAGTGPRLTQVSRSLHVPPYSNKSDAGQQNFALPTAHQPIKVKKNEKILLSECPNYDVYESQNFDKNSDLINQMMTNYAPFIERMSILFNFSLANLTMLSLVRCYDVAAVNKYLGRPLPAGFTDQDFKTVQHFANFYYYLAMESNNKLMFNTPKFQKLINTFDMRVRLPDNYGLRWTHLSGHDTDILGMHLALNISSATCVEQVFASGQTNASECEQGGVKFAANVFIQLHSNNGKEFYVKVRSNGKYMRICSKATYECEYTEFKSMIRKSMTTQNMEEMCGRSLYSYDRNEEEQQEEQVVLTNSRFKTSDHT